MSTENKLTDKNFWDDNYNKMDKFCYESYNSHIVKKIYKYFPSVKDKKIFEIGCFPGRFLYHFGKLGYQVNGVDLSDNLYKLNIWFEKENFNIGEFEKCDIFNFVYNKKYDIVFSSGFIEHFINFEEVIKIHTKLVNDSGYIYITTPNFSGFLQNILHKFLDKKNYDAHNIKAMNPEKWKSVLEKENFFVLDYGYIGGFKIWFANKNIFVRIFSKIIRVFFCFSFLPNTRFYSPDIYIIAKKM